MLWEGYTRGRSVFKCVVYLLGRAGVGEAYHDSLQIYPVKLLVLFYINLGFEGHIRFSLGFLHLY